jgi:hypothetical protein
MMIVALASGCGSGGPVARAAVDSSSDDDDVTTAWVVRDDGQPEVTTWDYATGGSTMAVIACLVP